MRGRYILRCSTLVSFAIPLYLGCGLAVSTTHAATPPGGAAAQLCPPGFIETPIQENISTDTRVQVSSDQAQIENDRVTMFSGDVHIQQGNKFLQADQIRYDRSSDLFDATGHIVYKDINWRFEGNDASFNLNADTGQIKQAQYTGRTAAQRGDATLIELAGKNKLRMENASYTTCPRGKEDWLLSAHTITLDNDSHQGTAESVSLQFMGVPFLFSPYLRFPIGEQRLSGFLFPGFSSSDRNGTELSLPFYWNIDPQYDMTINPHLMSKRGWMLESEFRYLGLTSNGTLNVNKLPNEKI